MRKREKEFNETVNACIVIQNQIDDCENYEELVSMHSSWSEFIKNQFLRRAEELASKS